MTDDPEAILDALAAGLTIDKAAKRFDMPAAEVRKILHDEIERCLSGEAMREAWTRADRRLAAIELKFYNRAMEGEPGSFRQYQELELIAYPSGWNDDREDRSNRSGVACCT